MEMEAILLSHWEDACYIFCLMKHLLFLILENDAVINSDNDKKYSWEL
jgi:hypothetical protein